MLLPRKVTKGEKITADWANSVVSYLHSIRPVNGVNVLVSQSANGTTFSAKRSGGRVDTTHFPLTAYSAGSVGDNLKIKIEVGKVSGIIPTIGGIEISENNAYLAISKSGTHYIHLQLNYTDKFQGTPTSVSVSSGYPSENEATIAYILLCCVADGKIQNYLSSSLGSHFCSPNLLYWKA